MAVVAVMCTVGPIVLANLTHGRNQPRQRLTQQHWRNGDDDRVEMRYETYEFQRISSPVEVPRKVSRLHSFSHATASTNIPTKNNNRRSSNTQVSSEISTDRVSQRQSLHELLLLTLTFTERRSNTF